MNTPQPSGRRMDGPIRRVLIQPIMPQDPQEPKATSPLEDQPVSPPAPVPSPPAAGSTPEPAFVYRKPKKPRWLRWVLLALLLVVLTVGGVLAFKAFKAVHKIIGKSNGSAPALAGEVDVTKLKGEGDGRVNILVLGIGGEGHDGPNLSDTIMVWSLDPKTKDVAMLSIPRDLYVKLPATAKTRTQYGKINSANAIGGPDMAKQVVEDVIGVPIHYYAVIDFSGFKQAVDAVGGIDLTVPQALYDPEFPCDNDRGFCPLSVKAGPQHMNGTQALRYARCRHNTCGGDFGRAARQQQVTVALREKALQAATLTNPVKIAGLIDTVGNHAKTDMQLNEIKKLALIAKDIDASKITNRVLDYGKPDSVLVDATGTIAGAGSIELPKAGTFDYSEIHDLVKNIFVDHYIVEENARIEVQNGSGMTGLAGQVVTSLRAAHYNVADPTNADQLTATTMLYDYTGGKKPYTINYLEHRLGVKAQRAARPSPSPSPATAASGTAQPAPDIRIILGSDYRRTGTTTQ